MEQSQKQKSLAAKLAIALAGVVITAVLSSLVQQLLFGKTIVAVTSAVVSVSIFMIWWLLWKSIK
jgi:uncharacterized membrane protein